MIKSRIGEFIDKSPFKNEYVRQYMGVSKNALSLWRSGKSIPSVEKSFKLSRLLGVTVEDLFEWKDDESKGD
ncbi:helix-turn-helix transcriptional regulator [Rossellomorea sp. BNER]|uniref:helix-turn-helix transcriptional regulator n=1 Tax=Rossellomorea sp. BNER TaxID=2962031 RepID=UPI003AF2AD92